MVFCGTFQSCGNYQQDNSLDFEELNEISFKHNDLTSKWDLTNGPIKLEVAGGIGGFTSSEIDQINDMAKIWNDSFYKESPLFNLPMIEGENIEYDNYYEYQQDGRFGIYKIHDNWLDLFDPEFIAVTITSGKIYNEGTPFQYEVYESSDILLNYDFFKFRSSLSDDLEPDTYDLKLVILHELGHVLGLKHPPEEEDDFADDSIMSSEIEFEDSLSFFTITDYDIESLNYRYGDVDYRDLGDSTDFLMFQALSVSHYLREYTK